MSSSKQGKFLTTGDIVETNEDETLGEIQDIILNPDTQQPMFLVTQLAENKDRIMIPVELLDKKKSRNNRVRLNTSMQETLQQSLMASGNTKLSYDQDSQGWRIPLAEERLQIQKKQIELGEFLIQKKVDETEQAIPVSLTHDEVLVEHVPINQVITAPVEPRQEGDWLIIPVMKEVLVVQKQLVVVEEIRIHKRAVTEQQIVRDTVKQERIEIEDTSKVIGNN